ncbi:HAD-IC family P-type ATPase [bacterium]|nr:HAD-IC family P-type ATPase [bacterium]
MDTFEQPEILKKRLGVSLLCTVPLAVLAWLLPVNRILGASAPLSLVYAVVQGALTVPVCVVSRPVFRRSLDALRSEHPGAAAQDALAALATVVCLIYSVYRFGQVAGCFLMGFDEELLMQARASLFFAPAACILTCNSAASLAGALLWQRAAAPAAALQAALPNSACVLRDRNPCTVSADAVREGDIVLLRPGDVLPADGVVLEGQSSVEESLLTGDPTPVDKHKGCTVFAGTRNGDSALICRATHTGSDTALAHICAAARGTAGTPVPLARQAERLFSLCVPALAGLAVVVLVVWLLLGLPFDAALGRAVAVLAAGCPLASLTAGPAALLACSMAGLKQGILFRSGGGVEAAANAKTVLLQKSGTITTDRPEVVELVGTRNVPARFLLGMAAGLESQSDDPMAQAVMRRALADKIKLSAVQNVTAVPGQGLCGKFAGKTIAGGSEAFIAAHCELTPDLKEAGDRLAAEGITPLYFSLDGHAAGLIGISEMVKKSSREAVQAMQALGLEVVLLTADPAATACRTGSLVGLDEAHVVSGLTPQTFADEVRSRRAALVAGPADAGALADAVPGIAIGTHGRPVDCAPVQLVHGDLACVPGAVKLARRTTARLRRALTGVTVYHIAALLLAVGVLAPFGVVLPPAAAALASALAAVVTLAALLRPEPDVPAPAPAPEESAPQTEASA